MTKLLRSARYFLDLQDIDNYLSQELAAPQAALRTVRAIEEALSVLEDFPEAGAVLFLPGGVDSGYRYLIHRPYMIFYTLREEEVWVARVLREEMDYLRRLFPGENE